ncbi:hypothetical protein QBC37DRAFT_367952 [Rhypophila decipiens]|uniref:GPI anchored protein n=1 Tax=Rhypophila decipiens TaxID=261697 RepID=A0AAN6YHT8_9PEZI|nr:hypothetical protein QBC37DRAFT_367952 [Rhypophila decipiens]
MRIHALPFSLWLLLMAADIEARDTQAQQQQSKLLPTAIKKMSPDQGEKFFPHYYAFADDSFAQVTEPLSPIVARRLSEDEDDERRLFANASTELPFRQPFAPHLGGLVFTSDDDDGGHYGRHNRALGDGAGSESSSRRRNLFQRAAEALAWLERRDWSCPSGTSSCAAIGYPNSCCENDEVCVEITDTGLGNVGCCPQGATCGGSVSQCSNGNTPCASDIGGGCCIPGYVCQGVGCVRSSTVTPVPTTTQQQQPPAGGPTGVTTITSTSTSTGQGSGSGPTTVVVTVIVTITPSQSPPQTTTRTTTQTTTAAPVTSNSNENPIPPIRPTSSIDDGSGNGNGGGSGDGGGINTFCPTGFYACVASAGGGCCQTGRDCQTTSCPPVQMTTIVNSNGITVAVAVPSTGVPAAATTGTCADGWFLCGKDAGPVAGCCPSGYACGTASCTVRNSQATGTVAKELPGSSNSAPSWRNPSRLGGLGAAVLVMGVVVGMGLAL